MNSKSHRPGFIANLVIGGIGMGLIIWFIGGLAWSIGDLAFGVIAIVVLAMALVDYVQTVRNPDD